MLPSACMLQSRICSPAISMHVECSERCVPSSLNVGGLLCSGDLSSASGVLSGKIVPPAVRSTVSVAIVFALVDRSEQISLTCMRNGETHSQVQILRWTPTRQLSERSLESSLAAALSSGFLAAWSYFRPPNVYTRSSIDTLRDLLCCVCAAWAAWCKVESRSTSCFHWGRGSTGELKLGLQLPLSHCRAFLDRWKTEEGRKVELVRWRRSAVSAPARKLYTKKWPST